MNRMRGYSNGCACALDDTALERELRGRAVEFREARPGRMRLRPDCAIALRKLMRRAANADGTGDEALRRLKADEGRIEACLRQAQADSGLRAPCVRGGARVLALARMLVCGGERRLTRERLLAGVRAFDEGCALRMGELQLVPAALNIALCEALRIAAADVLRFANARAAAGRWVRGEGRGRVRSGADEAFLERALQLSVELERPGLHARVERMIAASGRRTDWVLERAHRIAGDNCLRLENLMGLRLMLDGLDWWACFAELSPTEQELCADPAGVYPDMEEDSRARVRGAVESLSRRLRIPEIVVVRHALEAARRARAEAGGDDPRATVCWYLYEDVGRAALCRELGARRAPGRMIPDATGRVSVCLLAGGTLAAMALFWFAFDSPFLMLYALPLGWGLATRVVGRFYSHWVRPGHLLKLKLDAVPEDARTLVVLPVLLSSPRRAREIAAHMEALGCLERDENVDFLLLGDFRDADCATLAEDAEVLDAAREGVAALNRRAEREKYFYLHRARTLRERDARWMGENRKRGALTALNHLLLNREGAQEAFRAEGGCVARLAGHYRYVVTLDADTEYLPGTVRRLVGAMLHPLNRPRPAGARRGYAVLQPAMQLTAEGNANAYVELTAGLGGVDSYPVSISDFYQDVTGQGNFAGKGIYDVRAFAGATEGKLPDSDILSHDLIEGVLCGAGFVNDVCFYDSCPGELGADLSRLHRWTRGDWQLLPVLFSRLELHALDRMKLLGNLLRSLYAPALLGLFVHAAWVDAPMGYAVALALAFLNPILQLGRGGARVWRAALLQLAVLPATAACMLDAILRTLWRLLVSHRHLMEWVPAADAQGGGQRARTAGRVAALLMLPGLLRPFWIPGVLALSALFFVGADWAGDLSRAGSDRRSFLSAAQTALLMGIARRTWRFFETYVPMEGPGLPPDNVQEDPPVGVAERTSPTNIGLYLMACLSAGELGFLRREELVARAAATVSTLERLEKWNGQLYNWYDTRSLAPLRPRYVSAVDSGNLAGALLLCAHMLKGADAALERRMRALAEDMRLSALYDAERKLFRIGVDIESGRMSESYYDLYASESRILSYAAMMLGQVPTSHWKHLSRAAVRVGGEQALLSWSGTMFEYLMPELLLHTHARTLAGQSRMGVTACQRRFGRALNRPWGISESGYYAFDLHLNYQYRAFGLRALALSGSAAQDVVAPYAATLALCCDPAAAADNLKRMCDLGWQGTYGMYEAADYMHLDGQRAPRLVRSYMAHHQGMTLCALCNALMDDVLPRRFMEIPEARALRLLLQEKPGARLRLRRRAEPMRAPRPQERPDADYFRRGRSHSAVDVQLLHGGETTALVTARGGAFVWSRGLLLNRFSGDLLNPHEGMYVHLADAATGVRCVVGQGGRAGFDAGGARFREEFCGLRVRMRMAVSPEDGALYQQLEIENPGQEARTLEVTGCLAVALAAEGDMRAHPVFQNLFVESRNHGNRALVFRRRRREPGAPLPELVYLASGGAACEWEADLEKLVGRTGSLGTPGGLSGHLSGTTGNTLNPCAALRVRADLAPGETARLHFALLAAPEEEIDAAIERCAAGASADRAVQLAATRARAVLAHVGMDEQSYALAQRASAFLFDPKLRPALSERGEACDGASRSALWSAGISGDLPILLVEIGDAGQLDCVRAAIRLHGFYRVMGVKTDLVVVNNHGSDYLQPARGALGDLIASSHLNGCFCVAGGAFVLERQNLSDATAQALRRFAALRLNADEDAAVQLRAGLDHLLLREARSLQPMPRRNQMVPSELAFFNGYGGFDGEEYVILLKEGLMPPAPWCNVLASERAGAILTERGGGFAWHGSSRSGRLVPFANDVLREGWGWMFYLIDGERGAFVRLLPGDAPMTDFTVRFAPGRCRFLGRTEGLAFETCACALEEGVQFEIEIRNEGEALQTLELAGFVDWLMGTDATDGAALRTWSRFGACFASGAAEGVGVFASDDLRARPGCDRLSLLSGGTIMEPRGLQQMDVAQGGWTLCVPLRLRRGEARRVRFLLGRAEDTAAAYALARAFRGGELRGAQDWLAQLNRLRIETPDAGVNRLANGFLWAQLRNARILGRTGLYQPGGAFGFRDQLQDMLPLIHVDPARVRRHLLYCAARQFEAGDVLHWWHEPYTGVRTRIRDDLLFLPYVTAQYVSITGDHSVLKDSAPFLEDIPIPEGKEDIYAPMRPTPHCASLHEHCMRAFRRAAETGDHGLCLMGCGDWNDGMNRVGAHGRGESVWLTEFLAACAADYARIAPGEEERAWLTALNERLCAALEAYGWDGSWYLRAYADNGEKLGGAQSPCCRIDAISQAWAVLAGLDPGRCRSAMDAAWARLADGDLGLIRLLHPAFDGAGVDPGYIAAYPPGIRENGAQYTHAACWMLCALAAQGDAVRAHRALEMLLPLNHARSREAADLYRVEPYVMAADIYTAPEHAGRGGWTWYTGSAAWMLMAILRLLGYERRNRRVRLRALLGDWPEAAIELQYGQSRYRLVSRRGVENVELDGAIVEGDFIELMDDGRSHVALFPPRAGMERPEGSEEIPNTEMTAKT